MKKNSLQSYKVQYRLKTELKTMNQIPISPLRMSSLVVVHCSIFKNKKTKFGICIYAIWHTGPWTLDTHYRISRSLSCTTRNYKHCLPLQCTTTKLDILRGDFGI